MTAGMGRNKPDRTKTEMIELLILCNSRRARLLPASSRGPSRRGSQDRGLAFLAGGKASGSRVPHPGQAYWEHTR